jgi:hypothetical protein
MIDPRELGGVLRTRVAVKAETGSAVTPAQAGVQGIAQGTESFSGFRPALEWRSSSLTP